MLFNSIAYAIFLPVVFLLYWGVGSKNRLSQNFILLIASYLFYGWWDYRFLFLLGFSTFLDYFSGLKIDGSANNHVRKTWLILSVGINLAFLGVFKYYNFFVDSFAGAFGVNHANVWTLSVILPVGISFYTFHGLSYVFDIYNKKSTPTKNFVDYSLFVSFFPLLVAGPIERATHLLPQMQQPRWFDSKKAKDGLRQILWGLFKKIVVADSCAAIVNDIFKNPSAHSGSTLVYGAILFAIQIYCDFSGYSDIALGSARLFGFELIRNFNFPYFSRNVAEFWRRWHISLSTWFRDYLYIPMGGSKGGKWQQVRNTLTMFVVSGFWHGANWTFLAWGLFNGLLFLPLLLAGSNRKYTGLVAEGKILPSVKEVLKMGSVFLLITVGWILFRAPTIHDAFIYFRGICSPSLFSQPKLFSNDLFKFTLILFAVEWLQRGKQHGLQIEQIKYTAIRWAIYIALIYFICYYGGKQQGFIYFQF